MFPGMNMRNLDPKKMQSMMRQFGIKSEEIEAERVIIEGKGKRIVIEPASVTAVDLGGKKTYTVMGEEREEGKGISKEDIEMVVKQAGVSEKKARGALQQADGDIASAIVSLKDYK